MNSFQSSRFAKKFWDDLICCESLLGALSTATIPIFSSEELEVLEFPCLNSKGHCRLPAAVNSHTGFSSLIAVHGCKAVLNRQPGSSIDGWFT